MVTFELTQEAYQFVVKEAGPRITAGKEAALSEAEWKALQEAAETDGKYRVTCTRDVAAALADWFEKSREVVATIPKYSDHPLQIISICREAAKSIRQAIK